MNSYSSKYAPARGLEKEMGDPYGEGLFSFRCRVEEDEYECYPLDALLWLDRWGMQQHYVPFAAGGVLQDFEVLFSLVRAISRRDLTLAISHAVSFLGSIGVWIAGSQEQKLELALRLLKGERISLALTEREHGGDLLSFETSAYPNTDLSRSLHGEKWLINGATWNSMVSVLARTSAKGGPRGFSLFLFDKQTAEPGSFECLKKVKTLGVRGSDISGIRFHDAPLAQSALVGSPGQGFEVVLKGLLLSRLLCGAISLGAVETAFQVTLDFALERQIFSGSVFDIPRCRRLLVEAWGDLFLCESLLTAAARSLHFVPSEASAHSAVIKYLVPNILENALKQLCVVLGARYYLRQGHHSGIFQKILRDSSLVSLFDGSSIVNLYALTTQFPGLFRSWSEGHGHSMNGYESEICDLAAPLPEFVWSDLSLGCAGQNCFLAGLPSSIEAIQSLDGSRCSRDVGLALQEQVNFLKQAANTLMMEIGHFNLGSPRAVSSKAFDKAGDYCAVEGAAMVLQMWLANPNHNDQHFASGHWLVLALARLHAYLGQKITIGDHIMEGLADQLIQTQRRQFNSFPACA